MADQKRLIEVAFPLKQTSLDSVHEKNVRHGHISTLHIWPARRPLAACRAALIATLLPDPGTPEKRKQIVEKLGGRIIEKIERKKMPSGKIVEHVKEETVGGILHWGRESSPDFEWFRKEIRKAYGGRAPRVLDPFAGGGAIPLEAMRLGCEVTANDLNPVAWFILKCTLEYPQKLAGQYRPLPKFAVESTEFMEGYLKGTGKPTKKQLQRQLESVQMHLFPLPDADLAWHVRAWGWWVLQQARKDLARFYPTYADFEPLDKSKRSWERREMKRVPLKDDGTPDIDALNAEFDEAYLNDKRNPRWVAKPTVAYLWARTVKCKNCRATIPLLKTRWLCKKSNKRVLLNLTPGTSPPAPLHGVERGPHPRPLSTGRRGEGEKVPGYVYELCRQLRAQQTPAEQILWEALRARRPGGFKFRRQHPLGRYIADFYCAEASLVIELDGPIHNRPDQKEYDRIREAQLKARNLRLIRFKNQDIENNLEEVLRTILANLPISPDEEKTEEASSNPNPPLSTSGEGVRGVRFNIETAVPIKGSNAAQRREHDKRIGAGTMSRSGAICPCCGTIMTMGDIRIEGRAGRLDTLMTAVVTDSPKGKEYRLPTGEEMELSSEIENYLKVIYTDIPLGKPDELLPIGRTQGNSGFRVLLYGLDTWGKLYESRQLLALGTFVKHIRLIQALIKKYGYPNGWTEAIVSYLSLALDRVAERNSAICHYDITRESITGTFQRYALPMNWDFCEAVPISETAGSYNGQVDWIARYIIHSLDASNKAPSPEITDQDATHLDICDIDVVVTDPPYYDAIAYSDVMDFFYVWLKRLLPGLSSDIDKIFRRELSPKWNYDESSGELIDDPNRFAGDKEKSKTVYEEGMFRAFQVCYKSLTPNGKMVVVFAHKHPDAWETLVSAIIKAGFVVDGSWPIETEMPNRSRALGTASLASSVWLVCKKRSKIARPGWDNRVLEEMRENITQRLREFWDAGIRGPDFVWAATGPALEAYSKYPAVKKANEPGKLMGVSEFLGYARRMVVDFVVGRVLSQNGGAEAVSGLDEVTTYYLLHRHDFALKDAPIGPCILYAVSCGLSDTKLVDQFDILARTGGRSRSVGEDEASEEGEDTIAEAGTGSTVRLKPWSQRKRRNMGYEGSGGRPAPLIDQVHRLMHLWKEGDVVKVDDYIDDRGVRRNVLFHQLLQALIELADAGSEERSLLESISNHLSARGAAFDSGQQKLFDERSSVTSNPIGKA